MHAQQAGRRSSTRPDFAIDEGAGKLGRSPIRGNPVKRRKENRRSELDGRLLSRHHLRLILTAGAVVRIGAIIRRCRGFVVIATGASGLRARVVTPVVIVFARRDVMVPVDHGSGATGSTGPYPRMEVAAAERNHQRHEQGDEGPELGAAEWHTVGEYIGLPGSTSTAHVKFDSP